jgi:hypothetical protein
MSLAAIAIGFSTLFVPLVTFDGPVSGRIEWSAFDLVARIRAEAITPVDLAFNRVTSGLAAFCLLLFLMLLAVWFPRSRTARIVIAAFGSIAGYDPLYWAHQDFPRLLLGSLGLLRARSLGLHRAPGLYMLAAVMPALLLIAINEASDDREANQRFGSHGPPS